MADEPKNPLEEQGLQRLTEARRWKSLWDLDLREAYFMATPQRQRNVLSTSPPPLQRLLDSAELNTDLAFELCGDFATEVIQAYMPEADTWCRRGKGMYITEDQFAKIKDQIDKDDKLIHDAMKASNLYPEIAKAFDPDLSIGTVALWIEPPRPASAIEVMAIPIREFEINLGPNGEIDDRFAVRYVRNTYVQHLVGREIWDKVDSKIKKTLADKPNDRTEVRWGYWRIWEDVSDEVWQHVVFIGKDMVHDTTIRGEGSCPLVVFRWNPNPDWPWGNGPLLQYMPTLRQVDELEIQRMEHGELSLRPPIGYPDDSFAAIEQGLEPGMAYPMRSDAKVQKIYDPPPADAANYQYEEKEHRLRRGFYVDFPQQTGDTPPTLGQWLDERARTQRRLGRAGLAFFREGPAKIFLRFKYLLERAGTVKPATVDGKAIALTPYNPTQRAAEQQEIAMAAQFAQLMGGMFPEEWKLKVDGGETMKAFRDKMRVAGLIKFRPQDQVENFGKMIAPLVLGRQRPEGGGDQGGPAPASAIAGPQ